MADAIARVQRWNEKRFFAACPFCDKMHGHSFGGDTREVDYRAISRAPDCNSGDYLVAFPFNETENKAAYEIDKSNGQFVSAFTLNGKPSSVDFVADLRHDVPELVREVRPNLDLASEDVKAAVSRCLYGEMESVKRFILKFRGKEERNTFLHGEYKDSGDTVLHLAAMEETGSMVELLLREGCDVNAQNHRGRTPLMCAALWGRPWNVQHLLDHQADKTLRDEDGKLAIDFAKYSEENDAERYRTHVDKEIMSYVARRGDWKQVEVKLRDQATHERVFGFDEPDSHRPRYALQPDASFAIVTPVAITEGNAESEWTQVALLDRGAQFPPVFASSWLVNGVPIETAIGGQSLSQLVARIATLIAFELPAEPPSKTQHGVCHAEMQLIAYFVDKHVFLSDETMNEKDLQRLERLEEDGYDDQDESRMKALAQLKRGQPPIRLTQATILTSSAICHVCSKFCNQVNSSFGLELAIAFRSEGDPTSALVNLSVEFLGARCGAMHEAEALCRGVLSRMESSFGNQIIVVRPSLYTLTAPEEISIESVAARFYLLLEQYGSKPVAWRLVSTRSLFDALRSLHADIDRIEGDNNSSWEPEWEVAVATAKQELARNAEQDPRSTNLSDPEVQEEVLVLLVHELAKFKDYYTAKERKLLRRVLSDIAGLTKASVPESEEWFIPRHEVIKGSFLDSGSYADVHRGVWRKTEIVVKCLKIKSDADKLVGKRTFLREVRLWWKARHPNIVQILGACHVGEDPPFIVCEYVRGETFKEYLYKQRDAGKEKQGEAANSLHKQRDVTWRALLQVAEAVHFLHERKEPIIHGDIKSDNILMTKYGDAKLSDFGLSFEESGSRAQPEKLGALAWRAPEVVLAKDHDGQSKAADVYSLGMCIVEAVTGSVPMSTAHRRVLERRHQERTPMSKPDEMTSKQWKLVEGLCAYEPSERMPLKAAIDQLKDFANEEELAEKYKTTAQVEAS